MHVCMYVQYIAIHLISHYLYMLNLFIIFSNYKDKKCNNETTATVSRDDIFLSDNQCHIIRCAKLITGNDNDDEKPSGVTCVVHDLMVSNVINELNNTIHLYMYI